MISSAKNSNINYCLELLDSINTNLSKVNHDFSANSLNEQSFESFRIQLKSIHQTSKDLDKAIWNRYHSFLLPIQALMKPNPKLEDYKKIELKNLNPDAIQLLKNLFLFFDQIFSFKIKVEQNFPENELPKEIRYINTELAKLQEQARATLAKFGFLIKSVDIQNYKDAANTILNDSPELKNTEAIRRDLKLEESQYSQTLNIAGKQGKELIRRTMPWLTTAMSETAFVKAETWYNSSFERALIDFDAKVLGTGSNRLNISEQDTKKIMKDFAVILFVQNKLLQGFCLFGIAGMNQLNGQKFFNKSSTIHRRDALKRIRNAALCSAVMYTTCSKSINSMSSNNVYQINHSDLGTKIFERITKLDLELNDEKVFSELKKRCEKHGGDIAAQTLMTSFRHGASVASGVTGFYNPELIERAIDFSLAIFRK